MGLLRVSARSSNCALELRFLLVSSDPTRYRTPDCVVGRWSERDREHATSVRLADEQHPTVLLVPRIRRGYVAVTQDLPDFARLDPMTSQMLLILLVPVQKVNVRHVRGSCTLSLTMFTSSYKR